MYKNYILRLGVAVGLLALVMGYGFITSAESERPRSDTSQSLTTTLTEITPPPLPGYLDDHAKVTYSGERTMTYSIQTRGNTKADLEEFSRLVAETLADPRGWSRLGITFEEVPEGGVFSVVLAEASQMTSFSSGCHEDWSCNVGRNVIINETRWLGATDPWNAAGGSMRDYQHMVVNHEVGHNIGRDHESCREGGALAAVMQQQSFDLQGCVFNPWPLPSEVMKAEE